jgi:hypothetical protein
MTNLSAEPHKQTKGFHDIWYEYHTAKIQSLREVRWSPDHSQMWSPHTTPKNT